MNGSVVDASRKTAKRYRQRRRAEHVQVNILRGMCKEMPPTQAMVFMSYLNQFPELHWPGHYRYFTPAWAVTIRTLGIKRRAFWRMTRALVGLGYLERRWCGMLRGMWEYRIDFDKLTRYDTTQP